MNSRACAMFKTLCTVLMCGRADAAYVDINKCGDKYVINDDTFVSTAGMLSFYDIYIRQSVILRNMGDVYGDIHLCSGCHTYVRNSGNIIGRFVLGNNATLTQIIENASDMTQLDVSAGYNIHVRDMAAVSIDDISNMAAGVNRVIFENSSLLFSQLSVQMPAIELVGNNFIIVDAASAFDGMRLLSNVSGDGAVYAYVVDASDVLHSAATYMSDGDIYLRMVRSTDYARILGGGVGGYLDMLRVVDPESKLLRALDSAVDLPHMLKIMNESIRFNPSGLMRPVRAFDMMGRMYVPTTKPYGVTLGAAPIFFQMDDTVISATRFDVSVPMLAGATLNLAAYAGMIDGADEFDEYSGNIYGGYAAFDYRGRMVSLRMLAGGSTTTFDTPGLFDGANIRYRTDGIHLYSDVDVGVHFGAANKFTIGPTIGLRGEYTGVADIESASVVPNVGMITQYSPTTYDGIRYKYAANISVSSRGETNAAFAFGFTSDADMAGVNVGIGVLHDERATSYKLSVNATFGF